METEFKLPLTEYIDSKEPIFSSFKDNLQNGWETNGQSPFVSKVGKIVFLSGTMRYGKTELNTLMFTLPEAYRPDELLLFPIFLPGSSITSLGLVHTNGNVIIYDDNMLRNNNICFMVSWMTK